MTHHIERFRVIFRYGLRGGRVPGCKQWGPLQIIDEGWSWILHQGLSMFFVYALPDVVDDEDDFLVDKTVPVFNPMNSDEKEKFDAKNVTKSHRGHRADVSA